MHIVHNSRPYGNYEQEYLAWYEHRFNNPGKAFDPTSLVEAVLEQLPGRPVLARAFARCTREWPESELYTHFLSPQEVESRWKYAGGFLLQHPTLGALAVDTNYDADAPEGISIGGIEYLDLVMGRRVDVKKLRKAVRMLPPVGCLPSHTTSCATSGGRNGSSFDFAKDGSP